MRRRRFVLGSLGLCLMASGARADSIWQRRDPNQAFLFYDTRARRIGDVLTVVVRENTSFEGMEMRQLDKTTKTSGMFDFKGLFTAGKNLSHSFEGQFNGAANTERQLNGTANNTIDRKFLDQMSVMVIDVMPNGNLIIEGYRKRIVAKEERILRLRGIVRPQDIGPNNIVQSSFIADVEVTYEGKGQESAYQDNGWLGKIFNVIWPF